jgi:hypothetical protein
MKRIRNTGFAKLTVCASLIAALAACGGGSGSSTASSSASPATPPATSNAMPSAMSGTVAIGNALTNAVVTVTDVNGKSVSTTSGANGSYSVSITGLTAPFLIMAVDPSGVSSNLFSVAATVPTGTTAPVIANVTPLTTAVTAMLTQSGNPLDLTTAGSLASAVNQAAVTDAVTRLNTTLATILTANGLSATSFDPIGGTFTPNQAGADAVIDSIAVRPSNKGTGLQIASLADPDQTIPLNHGTTPSTVLQTPKYPVNYLGSLLATLGQCMAGNTSSCSTAIDSNYLNGGMSFAQRHTMIGTGTTLTGVKTLAFLPPGTLANISNPAALVYFLFTDSNGTPNFASDIVQLLPNGTWDIIGNQEKYNVYIASFVGQKQFTDTADANNGRFESGLTIQIPQVVLDGGVRKPVGSALVQGAGINGGGLYMLNTAQGLGQAGYDLTIPSTALTAPWTGCSTCAQSNGTTDQYKWSWTSLTGGTSTFSPNGNPSYTPQPIDVSTVPQYSVYTATLYDTTGNQISQPQKVINIAPNVTAAAAATVKWQTLGSDVINNFLTPGGSLAGAQTSLTLDWSVPANSQNQALPNFAIGIGAVTIATAASAQEAYSRGFGVTPTATAANTYSATVTNAGGLTMESLTLEAQRYVKLGWQADGVYYTNQWVYKN